MNKFKKVEDHKDYAVMRHPNGHEIKVAKAPLSPKYRAQLAAMKIHKDEAPKQPSVKQYAEGGTVEEEAALQEQNKPIVINVGQPQLPDSMINPSAGSQFASQQPQMMSPVQHASSSPDSLPFGVTPESVAAATGSMQQQQPQMPARQLAESQEPQAAPQMQQEPTMVPQSNLQAGLGQTLAGIQQGAAAQGALGQAQSQAIDQSNASLMKAQKDFETNYSKLTEERAALQHDMDNFHIDPNRYIGSMSTGSKILTGIGLILGGQGASDMLQHAIDNDINAQKSELGKKENLLSFNLKKEGNLRDALATTKIMINDMLAHKLQQESAKAQSPIAQAAAKQAIGQLMIQNNAMLRQEAMLRTVNQLQREPASEGGKDRMGQLLPALRITNPDMAKEIEGRYVPGVGVADVPVTAEVRSNIIAKQTLADRAKDLYQWSQKHSGSLNPATIAEGKTKAAELQSMYRNAINGGVFKKGEQEFIDTIIDSDPTKFFNNIRTLPKLKEVIDSNASQLNFLKKANGLPTSNAEMLQETATKGGHTYVKVDGGWKLLK